MVRLFRLLEEITLLTELRGQEEVVMAGRSDLAQPILHCGGFGILPTTNPGTWG